MFSERELKEASAEVVRAMAEHLPEPGACPAHAFSEEFERKMEKAGRRTEPGLFQKGLQAAACTAVVLLTTAGVVLAVNTEVRAEFFGWVQALSGQFFHYQFVGEENSEKYLYSLGYVPEGYSLVEKIGTEFDRTEIYADEDGKILSFSYSFGGDMYIIDFDHATPDMVYVGEYRGEYYKSSSEKIGSDLVWIDENNTLFVVSGFFNEQEMIKIAENVS